MEAFTGMPFDHDPFHCEVQPERERARVRPIGEIDMATVPVVEAHLSELKAAGFQQLLLDLRAVSFLDSTGLRMILEWDAQSRADGFAFSLVAGPPNVQRLFDLTATTGRLDFVDDNGDRSTGPRKSRSGVRSRLVVTAVRSVAPTSAPPHAPSTGYTWSLPASATARPGGAG